MNIAPHFLRGGALTLAGLGLSLVALQATGPRASADSWCFDDPVVQVNHTIAALNVGVAGSPDNVSESVESVTITVYVPDVRTAHVLTLPPGVLNEQVRFAQAGDDREAGDVHVAFQMSSHSVRRVALQVTANGSTTTVTGNSRQGLDAHFSID